MIDPFEDPAFATDFAAGVMPGAMWTEFALRLRRAEEFRELLRRPQKLMFGAPTGVRTVSDPRLGLRFLHNQQLAIGSSFSSLLWELGYTGDEPPTRELLAQAFDVIAGRRPYQPTGRHPF